MLCMGLHRIPMWSHWDRHIYIYIYTKILLRVLGLRTRFPSFRASELSGFVHFWPARTPLWRSKSLPRGSGAMVSVFLCSCASVFLCFWGSVFLCFWVSGFLCYWVSGFLGFHVPVFLCFCASVFLGFCVSVRGCCAWSHWSLFHSTLFQLAPCMDMHGLTLVYIYIYIYYIWDTYQYVWNISNNQPNSPFITHFTNMPIKIQILTQI